MAAWTVEMKAVCSVEKLDMMMVVMMAHSMGGQMVEMKVSLRVARWVVNWDDEMVEMMVGSTVVWRD